MDKHLFQRQYRKDLADQSKNTLAGTFWLMLEPVLMLLVYTFVFSVIFTARASSGYDSPFIAYLAVMLWPWFAFSQALSRSLSVLDENMGLMRKMALDKHALVAARVCSVFTLQMLAYLLVIAVLSLTTGGFEFTRVWVVLLSVMQLLLAALGLGYLLSALAVFVRDIKIAMPMLIMLMFFSSPIIWTMEMIPQQYRHLLDYNPITHVAAAIRAALLRGETVLTTGWWLNWLLVALLLLLGWWVFTRLAPWFEEYA
jgi:lipopolysaccharide transport system permease protein